ncbi:RNA polymerase sigma factor [Paenibacillus phyllosphaerae]|uniref:RNA polymerase sigma factor SigI n=1 Tax=Paenibacillus phyllosphaerae TaxID=274593 RepID=A0A7W5AU32_9BACL|nr:RNA polymerase sigma factor SigI [Paenibacillus phyllosphaerae]MBB3108683.1 RNA polymerase sigma factor [Paenibacillus phyllosphaerae]
MLLVLFKRFFGKQSRGASEFGSPEAYVARIHAGEASRDPFIASYEPYIAKVTSKFCKRYVNPACDDEFSVALSAFDEAITQFSPEAGRSFLGFAETVMRRRLIDYVRKEQRHLQSVPYSSFDTTDEDEQVINPIERQEALSRYGLQQEADARRLEIAEYNNGLKRYDIQFTDLPDLSPKHADSRLLLASIAMQLVESAPLFLSLEESGKMPIKELCELCGVSRKTIERNRKYIIAIALLWQGDYPYLQSYLQHLRPPAITQDAKRGGSA